MKSKFVLALGAVVMAASAMNARAALLVSDAFAYSNGNLAGNTPTTGADSTPAAGGPWTAYSSIGSHPIQVTSDAAVVDDNVGAEDDNIPFAGGFVDGAGTVLYASYTVTVNAPSGTLVPAYFGIFLQGTSNFDSRVWFDTPATPGDGFRIALTSGSTIGATSVLSTDLAFGTTYTIVTSYDFTNKNGSLWINPTETTTPPSSTPVGTTTAGSGFSDASTAYAFRQSSTAGNAIVDVGNLVVFSQSVPEPASLGLLFGASGLVFGRRSRRRI